MSWIIIGLVLLAMYFLPLGADIRYDSMGFRLMVIAGPVRIRVLPRTGRHSKEKKRKEPDALPQKSQDTPGQTKSESSGGSLTDFLPVVRTGLSFLNSLRRKLRINRLDMKLIMAGDDPCDLAVNYGRAWTALGNLQPALEKCFVIRRRELSVCCDFEGTQTLVIVRAELTISLGRLLWLLLRYGVQAIHQYLTIEKHRKGGIQHEQEPSQHAGKHHFQNP